MNATSPLQPPQVDLERFYYALKNHRPNTSLPKLSKREVDCLYYFIQGKSCREIGSCLHLSPRTIEAYFVSIKDKLNCSTKSDLFQCVKEMEQFGLLKLDTAPLLL